MQLNQCKNITCNAKQIKWRKLPKFGEGIKKGFNFNLIFSLSLAIFLTFSFFILFFLVLHSIFFLRKLCFSVFGSTQYLYLEYHIKVWRRNAEVFFFFYLFVYLVSVLFSIYGIVKPLTDIRNECTMTFAILRYLIKDKWIWGHRKPSTLSKFIYSNTKRSNLCFGMKLIEKLRWKGKYKFSYHKYL